MGNRFKTLLIASFAELCLLAAAQHVESEIEIHRRDLPHLGTEIPFVISSDESFAIVGTATGTLARLDIATGRVVDLRIEIPKRYTLLRLILGTDLLAYYDETAHSLVTVDTKLSKQKSSISLPDSTDELPVVAVMKKPRDVTSHRKSVSLIGKQATGLWISSIGNTAIIAFQHVLIRVDLARKTKAVLPNVSLGGKVSDVSFSEDECAIVIAARGGLREVAVLDLNSHDRIFDVSGFQLERRIVPTSRYAFYPSALAECTEIRWSCDNSTIAGIVNKDRTSTVRTWDANTGAKFETWSNPKPGLIDTLEILPGAMHCLVVASTIEDRTIVDRNVILLELKTLKEISRLGLPLGNLRSQGSHSGRIYFFNGSDVAFSIGASTAQ